MTKDQIILASGSPRRSEILKQLGVNFRVVVSNEDEKPTSSNPLDFPREKTFRLASQNQKTMPSIC